MNEGQYRQLARAYREGRQEDFTILRDELLEYATWKAAKLDREIPAMAVDSLLDLFWTKEIPDGWKYAQKVIDNFIKNIRRSVDRGRDTGAWRVQPTNTKHFVDVYTGDFDEEAGDYVSGKGAAWAWGGHYLKDRHGCPGILPGGREGEICRMYWFGGKEQKEIADELGLSKGYVSRIIKKYRATPKPDTRDSFTSGRFTGSVAEAGFVDDELEE